MAIYSEYLDKKMDLDQLTKEPKAQLKRISEIHRNPDLPDLSF